ncbi:glycerol kinase GlpK [Paenibacillus sp. PL2-23]|uniref:glycerol kinase GlpK n=1 Tax=Paenibacillus sp. PL2-23 TaxID=2100729 RepID=UPI0030FCC5CC
MANREYVLAVDQSTSGTKALLVDKMGSVLARGSAEHTQYYPRPGWVEHDPVEIYENVKQAIRKVMTAAGIRSEELAALTITNQRETAVLWDRATGLPVGRAIVWQCQRTAVACAELRALGYEESVREKTGLMLDPYFSATKWSWLLDHIEGARARADRGELLAGTIDSWLLWKLTGGKVHATDYTNASRTQLFNISTLQWDEELCQWFRVPIGLLPEAKDSDAVFGEASELGLFDTPVPISGVIGDSQAALFGHLCLDPGMAKATYGTGTSVLMNVGDRPIQGVKGLVNTVAWGRKGKATYALEAVIRTSGDSLKWVRDNLGLFQTFEELDALLQEANEHEGVYLVPAFVGLGAPYWAPDARASIIGLNRGSGRAQIVRAAIDSIAYQVRDAVQLLQEESGVPLIALRADGGASDNRVLMQFQADMLGQTVLKSNVSELSALGSVYMGGLGVGFWQSEEEIAANLDSESYIRYSPFMEKDTRATLYQGWKAAVATVLR